MSTANVLDTEELLYLSIKASQNKQHEDAIRYLKQALETEPNNAKVHYMLGAEHAEIGLYDRAALEMAKAVELDPSLVTAQFQLGLLHITSGRVTAAEQTWVSLDKLGKSNPFYLFKTGLLQLARDDMETAKKNIEDGIAKNTTNIPLNKDMQRILEQINQNLSKAGNSPALPATKNKAGQAQPKKVVLTAYKNDKDTDE